MLKIDIDELRDYLEKKPIVGKPIAGKTL